MAEKPDLRELFLNNFVCQLIANSKPTNFIPSVEPQIEKAPNNLVFQPMIKMPKTIQPILQMPQPKIQKPATQVTGALPSLNKIGFIIKDPTVTEIECTGAGENLLVKKAGMIQKTKEVLTAEEIKAILNEFSAKTNIPIIEGTFKAALENLILTAVISEILGPRFIIQKRTPFQSLFT